VALNGAKNAGILAAQIIGASDASVRQKIESFKKGLEENVLKSAQNLKG
jgi:5-(carboxyamino)imidazole ribonucleotide mutase